MSQVFACQSIMMFATDNELLTKPLSLFAWDDEEEDEENFGDDDEGGWEEE